MSELSKWVFPEILNVHQIFTNERYLMIKVALTNVSMM